MLYHHPRTTNSAILRPPVPPRRPLTPEALATAMSPVVHALEPQLLTHPALLTAWRARLGPHPDAALARGLAQAATYAAVLAPHAPPAGWLAQALTDLRSLPDLAAILARLPAAAAPPFHLFEHLLAASDHTTRTATGAYYTPLELVHAQLALTGAALHEQGLDWTHPRVHVLDPACGAGIYPHTLLTQHPTLPPAHLHASELLPGPAIAAHGHLSAAGLAAPNIHCHDTLTSTLPPFPADAFITILGNPPYSRHPAARTNNLPLSDFTPRSGAGIHAKNLYNDYVYFWHWALSTALAPERRGGLVCFVTAASWLRGPGFATMRAHLRARCDDLWIFDLGGDSLGPQRSPNIFKNVRIPVAITLAVRRDTASPRPATIHYTRLPDHLSREDRLRRLAEVHTFADLEWTRIDGPTFVPVSTHTDWPRLTDLFPWQHSGAQFKRTWPIGQTPQLLKDRWHALLAATDRAAAFHETRDRTVSRTAPSLHGDPAPPLAALPLDAPPPPVVRYAFRSFDRQWCLLDARLGDFLRPPLWRGPTNQIFLTSLLSVDTPSRGPAVVATAHVPDLHHYSGRGGADVLPLYRDETRPNITPGLLTYLTTIYQHPVTPEDLLAYVYALLAHPAYTATLREPGPRVPMTRAPALFHEAVALGRDLLRCHTFGQRMNPTAAPIHGRATATPLPRSPYPAHFNYARSTQTLHIGTSLIINNLAPEVYTYEVSALKILPSWLGYRMQRPRGRASSPLDAIRPTAWTDDLTTELLELVWTLEHSLALHTLQADLLTRILAAPRLAAADLPRPTDADRRPP